MAKSNIRSFRYSDKVSNILEDFKGASLNEKFENLVLFCFDNLEARKRELKSIESNISKKREEYFSICNDIKDLSGIVECLTQIEKYSEMAERRAKSVVDKLDK